MWKLKKNKIMCLWLSQSLDCKIMKMPLSLIKHQGIQLHEDGEVSLQNFDTTVSHILHALAALLAIGIEQKTFLD
jgi:hypothetical protein